jgi:CRISPR/Cas system CSM-associated protein Csm3 (group 7 of RAMP superfamily)
MFGAGFGDKDADQTPVYEEVVDYKNSKLTKKQILMPASSIKGALSHRTAFYYNKMMLDEGKDYKQVEEKNDAVKAIFGHKKELAEDKKTELGQKGKVLFSDCFKECANDVQPKVFDHVSIDRFTGGAIEGALFNEKTIAQKDTWLVEILLEKSVENTNYIKAFEKALDDVCTGMLALGGATTKGYGAFEGTVIKDGEVYNVGN